MHLLTILGLLCQLLFRPPTTTYSYPHRETLAAPPPTGTPAVEGGIVSIVVTPTPVIRQQNVPSVASSTVEDDIVQVFGSSLAVAVFRAESSLNPRAFNGICCYGVTQINLSAHWSQIPGSTAQEKIDWLFDYHNNIAFAYSMYISQGWSPWEAYTSGLYRKYL